MGGTDPKQVPMGVLLTATTGRVLARPDFGAFHAFAEWLYQRQIWTHEFVALAEPLKRDVLAQHPDLPSDDAGVTPENFRERREALEAQYGASRLMRPVMTQPRTADPLTTLQEAMAPKEPPHAR